MRPASVAEAARGLSTSRDSWSVSSANLKHGAADANEVAALKQHRVVDRFLVDVGAILRPEVFKVRVAIRHKDARVNGRREGVVVEGDRAGWRATEPPFPRPPRSFGAGVLWFDDPQTQP